ncbi:MAG: hypothetical protein JKY65_02250 [Planctomycetes bacterium]|nr:hypothetical protein [Planctomycetota bacterium]
MIDYSLQNAPLELIGEALAHRPDVIGVGVNFGQWRLLEELAEFVERETTSWSSPPVVVLGNILAAFSPDEAAKPFRRATAEGRVLVATGLGERPLERLCRCLDRPDSWADIQGLAFPTLSAPQHGTPQRSTSIPLLGVTLDRTTAPSLVAPDDALVIAVATQGGQVSLETSLGCQFGACTFCPRSHKGKGWLRSETAVCVAILERMSHLPSPHGGSVAVSLVDEEFFGAEGLADPPPRQLPAARILTALKDLGLRYEIYTRLEQLFDRRRSREWNLQRATLLAEAAPQMRRLFVGVESGSPSQLRRYGKGQTVVQTIDALRVASRLAAPLEFGFITFDPLLTPEELAENLVFLARTDVLCDPASSETSVAIAEVGRYLDGAELPYSGEPVYQHVAYMATELEVLANSRYADYLHRKRPDLLDGYDPAFCRFGTRYDQGVGEIASWCRVWTEGMFTPVYQARMAARSAGPGGAAESEALVRRYRDATFALLVALTRQLFPGLSLPSLSVPMQLDEIASWEVSHLLADLSILVTRSTPTNFDLSVRERQRDR